MKVRKTMKKIAALGVGASMLGATVLGATAADLSNFPSNYMEDGKFQGSLVVGDNAISSDTIGAIDIATGLASSSADGSGEAEMSEGAKIESTGDQLNIDETFESVLYSAMDDSDLPNILDVVTYEDSEGENEQDTEYDQELSFEQGEGTLVLNQDDEDAPEGGLYTEMTGETYTYSLDFDDTVEFAPDAAGEDLKSTNLEIQGNTYTITDVDTDGDLLDEVTLQSGETTQWIEQGQPITKNIGGQEREIELSNVDEDATQCGIMVDGTLKWVDDDSTDTINGVDVGVTDAVAVHSETKETDVCRVNLGSEEIVLSDGDEVEVNSNDVDGSDVSIDSAAAGDWNGFSITQEPEEDVYLAEGDAYVDPVFDNFEINMAGIEKPNPTDVNMDVSGDTMTLSFNNIDGESVELPFTLEDDANNGGMFSIGEEYSNGDVDGSYDEVNNRYYLGSDMCQDTTNDDLESCEGARTLAVEGEELRVVEIEEIDLDEDDPIVLKDVTDGGTEEGKFGEVIEPGIQLTKSEKDGEGDGEDTITFANAGNILGHDGKFKTENELVVDYNVNANGGDAYQTGGADSTVEDLSITFDEQPEGNVDNTGETDKGKISLAFGQDTEDEEWNVNVDTFTQPANGNSVDASESNDDDQIYYSAYGTKVVHDDDESNSLDLSYSEEELSADVYVAPVGAVAADEMSEDDSSADTSLEVGSAKLASEVSLDGQNTILVGGPCANQKSAEFAGVSMDNCAEGAPEENTAVIKLKEYGDKVSMMVNGYSAMDTRRASRVVANYGDYDLSGSEMVVSGTGFTDIDVSAPSPEADGNVTE